MAGYGTPYIGKSGARVVKYYDAHNKYLGYSSMTRTPKAAA
jgi:hypothetical protein